MNASHLTRALGHWFSALAIMLLAAVSLAADTKPLPAGKFKVQEGKDLVITCAGKNQPLVKGKSYRLMSAATIKSTASSGMTTLIFSNGLKVFIEPGAVVQVDEFGQEPLPVGYKGALTPEQTESRARFSVLSGSVFFVPGKLQARSQLAVTTVGGVVTSKGNFYVQTAKAETIVSMQQGTGEISPRFAAPGKASITLRAGRQIALRHAQRS